jgi:predicted nucleic acid-binding Zn finger protein
MEHEENIANHVSWLYKKCRTCSHDLLYHLLETGRSLDNILVGQCNYFINMQGFCNCSEFMSLDNLDYIELLAKRKGLIPEKKEDK